ncbi:MAG: DUF4199 domain-containing protein [Thermoanaerobaculia bacterium]|nr:DUF4199 domain-containing protein [Thermoanaerobaculia bacterium]
MSPKRTILTWGLIAGAVSISMMLATMPFVDRIGFEHGMVIGYTALVLSALMIYPGVRSYRDNVAGGRMTFGKGLLVGLGIALVAAVCYGVIWAIVYANFMPDFCDKYTAYTIEQVKSSGGSAEKIAEATAQAAQMKRLMDNPLTNAAMAFLEPFPIGILVSLVSAGILRRK